MEEIVKTASFKYSTLRDKVFRKYIYHEQEVKNLVIKDFYYSEDSNEFTVPEWWRGNVHNRLPRGVIKKLSQNINSALSNLHSGNISHFKLGYISKREIRGFFHFEDSSFPVFLKRYLQGIFTLQKTINV